MPPVAEAAGATDSAWRVWAVGIAPAVGADPASSAAVLFAAEMRRAVPASLFERLSQSDGPGALEEWPTSAIKNYLCRAARKNGR